MKFPRVSFSFHRMFEVTGKEYKELIRNRMSFILSLLAPILLYFLFAYGMPMDVKNIPLAILDEDRTEESSKLISALTNNEIFVLKTMLKDFEEIDRVIRKGDVRACVVIPQNFSKRVMQGKPQQIALFIDAIYTSRAQLIDGYAQSMLSAYNAKVLSSYYARTTGTSKSLELPVTLYDAPWFNPAMESNYFIIPGVIAIILIFLPPILAAISVTKEKESGSIVNMLSSPVTSAEYLLGKMLPYIGITYINFLSFLFFTLTIFRIPLRGSVPLLMVVTLIYVFNAIGVGLLVAVLVRTQIAAILVCSVATIIPAFMYSGFLTPLICLDKSARQTALSLPTTYYLDFLRKLMIKGIGIQFQIVNIVTLVCMGLFLYILSIKLFRKKLG